MCLHSSAKTIFTTGTSLSTTDSSAKSISGVTFVRKCARLVYVICLIYRFSFFSVITTFLMFLFVFSNSNVLIVPISSYQFPSLNWVHKLSLNWHIVMYVEIVKRCVLQNQFFEQHDHIIEFIDSILFSISYITLKSHLWYPFFLSPNLKIMLFLHLLQTNKILRKMKNNHMDLMDRLSYNMIFQKVGHCWVTTINVMNLFFFLMNPFTFF